MTNLQKFKKGITKDNLCDMIMCSECPVATSGKNNSSCMEKLKQWCEKEAQK